VSKKSLKNDILIIEDSPAIGLLLKNYFEKLGYNEIHTCVTGSSAISKFNELVSEGKEITVFLDYMLPDMGAHSIFIQMIKTKPDTKIILETATEKEDAGIKELISLGAYRYIAKPIQFANLKNIMNELEEEQTFFMNESEQTKELKQNEEQATEKIEKHIDFILKTVNQISLNKITQVFGFEHDLIIDYLKKLEKDGKIIPIGERKEIACNQCNSAGVSQIFFCPSCKNSDFKLGKLIEHYDCGNITEENTYANDKCPNCNKEIKALGVDHRVMKNHYICNVCQEFFPEISTAYHCLKCENKFKLEDAKWKSSHNYKVVNT